MKQSDRPEIKLLTVRQVAEALELTEWTVRRMCKDGRLNGKKIGRLTRIPEPEVIRYIEDCAGTAPDEKNGQGPGKNGS